MAFRLAFLVFLAFACACNGSNTRSDSGVDVALDVSEDVSVDGDAVDGDGALADVPPPTECEAINEAEVVTFTTDDGVMIEGDLYETGIPGGAAAVLLHMIPPGNTRANYPIEFISAMTEACITVLNIDRRGAGGSTGVATQAYTGPNGVLDAKGATEFLLARENAPHEERFVIVGASNGTTTAVDFGFYTKMSRTVRPPAVFVLLSGGTYTENQNTLVESDLANTSALFAFPTSERAWNLQQMEGAPATWRFNEYTPGSHGTGLFTSNPESIRDVVRFAVDALP